MNLSSNLAWPQFMLPPWAFFWFALIQVTRTYGGTAAGPPSEKGGQIFAISGLQHIPRTFCIPSTQTSRVCDIFWFVFFDFLYPGWHVFMPLCRERTGRFFIISLQSTTLPLVWMNHFLRFANRSSRKLRPCHLTPTTYRNLPMLESGQTGNSTVKKMRSIAKGILFFITYLSLPSQKDRMIGAHIGGLAIEICWKLLKTCQRLMLLALYIFQKRWRSKLSFLQELIGNWFNELKYFPWMWR